MLPCFVVNIERDLARRENIKAQLKEVGLDFTITQAVDGRVLSEEELARHQNTERALELQRLLVPGEIGCALSHRNIYKEMMERNLPYALVLEDDAQLLNPNSKNLNESKEVFISVLKSVVDKLKINQPLVVLLSHVSDYQIFFNEKLSHHYKMAPIGRSAFRTHAYILTLEAAKSLYHHTYPFYVPCDYWVFFQDSGFLKVKAVVPYLVGLSDFANESLIEESRSQAQYLKKKRKFPFFKRMHNSLIKRLSNHQDFVW